MRIQNILKIIKFLSVSFFLFSCTAKNDNIKIFLYDKNYKYDKSERYIFYIENNNYSVKKIKNLKSTYCEYNLSSAQIDSFNSFVKKINDTSILYKNKKFDAYYNFELVIELNNKWSYKYFFTDELNEDIQKLYNYIRSLYREDRFNEINYKYSDIIFYDIINENEDTIKISNYFLYLLWKDINSQEYIVLNDYKTFDTNSFDFKIDIFYPLDYKQEKISKIYFKNFTYYLISEDNKKIKKSVNFIISNKKLFLLKFLCAFYSDINKDSLKFKILK